MVNCEFSETTFGFALTYELVQSFGVTAAPRFPTLRQEVIRGYDVSLSIGEGESFCPLFLQFKVPNSLNPNYQTSKPQRYGLNLSNPSYKFPLYTQPHRNHNVSQHKNLFDLNQKYEQVYYASPEFNEDARLVMFFKEQILVTKTAFFKPKNIGELDRNNHHVYYDEMSLTGYVCSKPIEIKRFKMTQIKEQMEFSYSWNSKSLETLYRELTTIKKHHQDFLYKHTDFMYKYDLKFISDEVKYFMDIQLIARLYFGCDFFPVTQRFIGASM